MARILRSNQAEPWSTYQIASANFFSMRDGCARSLDQAGYIREHLVSALVLRGVSSRYFISSGHGPIQLMSRLSTLINSGNSSRLVQRSNCPNAVMRSSSGKSPPSTLRVSHGLIVERLKGLAAFDWVLGSAFVPGPPR
jgi:hypothetical protein